MYPIIEGKRCESTVISPLRRLNEVSKSRPLHRRSIHAEFKPIHRLNEVSKNGGASPSRTLFVHCPDFGSKSKFFRSRPLHRRSIHAEFKPLHRLNEVSEKWRSISFTDAFVHCPDFGSKSKFYRSRPSPHNLWETTRGPRRKKQDMLQLAEELGINATLNMTVPSIKIAITNSEGYKEEFVKNLYEIIIANGKRLEELERDEKKD
ncbi:hypothetical protein TNCV_3798411 [Trichonephila clavipes]|nr:hypothetical protein TNCV_3798411 [Trichonephila clavipes]